MDISIILRLINQMTAPAKQARAALEGITKSAKTNARLMTQASFSGANVATAYGNIALPGRKAKVAIENITKSAKVNARFMLQTSLSGARVTATYSTYGATAARVAHATTVATRATSSLRRQQFALGRAIIQTRRNFLRALPAFESAGGRMGSGLRMMGEAGVLAGQRAASLGRGGMTAGRWAARNGWTLGKRGAAISGLSLVGVGAMGRAWADATDQQAKFAKQTGYTLKGLQELTAIAGKEGIGVEQLERTLETLTKRMGQLKTRTGPLDKLLTKVNRPLSNKLRGEEDPEKALEMILSDMERVKDPAKRQLYAQTAFGDAGTEMLRLVEMGKEGRAKSRAEMRRLRGTSSEDDAKNAGAFNDAWDTTGAALMGVRDQIARSVVPELTPMLIKLREWLVINRELIGSGLKGFISDFSAALQRIDFNKLVSDIRSISETIKSTVENIGGWRTPLIALVAFKFRGALKLIAMGLGRLSYGFASMLMLATKATMPILRMLSRQFPMALARTGAAARRHLNFSRFLAVGGGLALAEMAFNDFFDTQEERVERLKRNWANWDSLSADLNNSAFGKWYQSATDEVQRWKTAVTDTIGELGEGLYTQGASAMGRLLDGFKEMGQGIVDWVKGMAARITSAFKPEFKLPSWAGGGGEALGSTDPMGNAVPSMADVVNEVDQSETTHQNVSVTNQVTINATTNASPGAIGAAVAGAAASGTRRGLGGLHDGGAAGSTYGGQP